MGILNFVRVMKMDKKTETDFFDIFGKEYDRFGFPEGIERVTAGHGGEAVVIRGSEKTALMDCGMAYCGAALIENLQAALNGRPLDYVLLSHSHYDHIGALPYVKQEWPDAVVFGAEHASDILPRPGARKLMKELGEAARDRFSPGSDTEILIDPLAVDKIIGEGDRISLGDRGFTVLETKGHTDCSLTFILEPDSIMFTSESTGILERLDYIHTPILKSYEDSMDSFKKCREYKVKRIVLPHFGLIPEDFNEPYWELYEKEVEDKRKYLAELKKEGISQDEVFERYAKKYWDEAKAQEQPYEAFMINSKHIVKALMESLE